MSPKKTRFNFMIEPGVLAALKTIEIRTGAGVGEQIRRAVQAYLEAQTIVSRPELKKLMKR